MTWFQATAIGLGLPIALPGGMHKRALPATVTFVEVATQAIRAVPNDALFR